jgi:hypothetical protein
MQRSEIHTQIAEVSEKIAALNRQLSQSSKLLKAETGLLLAYVEELQQLIMRLENTTSPDKKPISDIIINEPRQPEVIISGQKATFEIKKKEIATEKETTKTHSSPKTISTAEAAQSKSAVQTSLNDRFKKNTVELGEKLQVHTGKHLKDLFSLSDKFMFANELFKNDQKYFDEVLKKLNEFETWDEVVGFIEDELQKKFNWDKKEKIAEQFRQIIRKRYL